MPATSVRFERPPRRSSSLAAVIAATLGAGTSCATGSATAPAPTHEPQELVVDAEQAPVPGYRIPPPPQAAPEPPPAAAPVPGTWYTSPRRLDVRRSRSTAARRGIIAANTPFSVTSVEPGPGCAAGWGAVLGGGVVCLDGAAPTEQSPAEFPRLVAFDPPEPLEWFVYSTQRHYTRDPVDASSALLPYIYAKPYRKDWTGQLYASVDAFARGDAPVGSMQRGDFKYSFVRAVETDRGTVIVRKDGKVAAADDVFFYPVDRFAGRDLVADPPAPGTAPGWAIGYSGAPVYASPDRSAGPVAVIPYHHEIDVDVTPADAARRWWRVADALGPGTAGYLYEDAAEPTFRRYDPLPASDTLTASGLWIDVDLRQQVLTLYQGTEPVFMTLVSSGREYGTPVGLYRVYDKFAYHDMEGRPDADYDPYRVEDVPWTMHFYPRYALHAAFWHWGFGHTASHGCVNLAPADARTIYNRIAPVAGPGWLAAYEAPDHKGTLLRVHRDNPDVPDKRELAAPAPAPAPLATAQ